MNIRKEIRKVNIKGALSAMYIFIYSLRILFGVLYFLKDEQIANENTVIKWIAYIIFPLGILSHLHSIFNMFVVFFICLSIIINPRKSELYRRFANDEIIAKAIEDVKRDCIYNSDHIIISERYFYYEKDIESLVKCEDITGISERKIQDRNKSVYTMKVTGKGNYERSIEFSKSEKEKCDARVKALSLITSLSVE